MNFIWRMLNTDTRSLFYINYENKEVLLGDLFKNVFEEKIVWAKVVDIDWVPKSMIINSSNLITAKANIDYIIKSNLSNIDLKFNDL